MMKDIDINSHLNLLTKFSSSTAEAPSLETSSDGTPIK